MCLSSRLWPGGPWIVIPSLESWVLNRSTDPSSDSLWACVPPYISSHVYIVPSIPLWLVSQILTPVGGRTQSFDCVLRIPVSHDLRRVCLSCTSGFWTFKVGVEKSLSTTNPPLLTTKLICQISTPDQFLWAHWWCFCVSHLLRFLSPLGTPRPHLLFV